nr:MAG TPA: capsid [Picobirnaviridae sp.]
MARNRKKNNFNSKGESGSKPNSKFASSMFAEDNVEPSSRWETKWRKSSGGSNDPAWYSKISTLYNQATKISTGYPTGLPLQCFDTSIYNQTWEAGSDAVNLPGIMTIGILPGIGVSTSYKSAPNIASQAFFSNIRRNKSGTSPYDAPDAMMYIIGLASMNSMLMWLQRLYMATNKFSAESVYLPRAMVTAMGFNYEDIMRHRADLLFYINYWQSMLKTKYVPTDLTYFKKQVWLFANVYSDSDTSKPQYYMFNPEGFYKYVEVTNDPSYLELMPLNLNGTMTFDNLVSYCEEILWSFIGSQSLAQISSDIGTVYGTKTFVLPDLQADATLDVAHNTTVLNQINNMLLQGYINTGSSTKANYRITQNVDDLVNGPFLVYNPLFFTNAPGIKHPILLNFYWDDVTADDVIEATRFVPIARPENVVTAGSASTAPVLIHHLSSSSDAIATTATIWYLLDDKLTRLLNMTGHVLGASETYTGNSNNWNWTHFETSALEKFDWHMPMYGYTVQDVNSTNLIGYNLVDPSIQYDIDNFALVADNAIDNMHRAALLSEFDIDGSVS